MKFKNSFKASRCIFGFLFYYLNSYNFVLPRGSIYILNELWKNRIDIILTYVHILATVNCNLMNRQITQKRICSEYTLYRPITRKKRLWKTTLQQYLRVFDAVIKKIVVVVNVGSKQLI